MKVNDVRKYIDLLEFPYIYKKFLGKETDTLELERKGKELKDTDGDTDVRDFIKRVFKWGGQTGYRIQGMLDKYEEKNYIHIAKVIRKASCSLEKRKLKSAIKEVTSLKGLGISYGSKILRMLSPQQAGVYDSLLAKHLCYQISHSGYVEFCSDCQKLSNELQRKSNKHPHLKLDHRKNGVWYVADVEAVIYEVFRSGRIKLINMPGDTSIYL